MSTKTKHVLTAVAHDPCREIPLAAVLSAATEGVDLSQNDSPSPSRYNDSPFLSRYRKMYSAAIGENADPAAARLFHKIEAALSKPNLTGSKPQADWHRFDMCLEVACICKQASKACAKCRTDGMTVPEALAYLADEQALVNEIRMRFAVFFNTGLCRPRTCADAARRFPKGHDVRKSAPSAYHACALVAIKSYTLVRDLLGEAAAYGWTPERTAEEALRRGYHML